jgi:hypothetical protein
MEWSSGASRADPTRLPFDAKDQVEAKACKVSEQAPRMVRWLVTLAWYWQNSDSRPAFNKRAPSHGRIAIGRPYSRQPFYIYIALHLGCRLFVQCSIFCKQASSYYSTIFIKLCSTVLWRVCHGSMILRVGAPQRLVEAVANDHTKPHIPSTIHTAPDLQYRAMGRVLVV